MASVTVKGVKYGPGYDECTSVKLENAGKPFHNLQTGLMGVWPNVKLEDKNCCPAQAFLPDTDFQNGGILFGEFLFLCYIFLGVAIGADVFMTSIEVITSQEKTKKVKGPDGEEKLLHFRVWNPTVANLTLMALGSSAPEILLSVLEVFSNNMAAGALGPSTIVGSAAFNLMVITAVCVVALPDGEVRTLKQLNVFYITSAYSLWAYIWLLLIVVVITPEFIDVWEAALTVVFLVLLVAKAYIADKYSTDTTGKPRIKGASLDKQEAIEAIKAAGLKGDATEEQIREALKDLEPPKTKAYYKRKAMEDTLKTKQLRKVHPDELQEVAVEGNEELAGVKQRVDNKEDPISPDDPGTIVWSKDIYKIPESGGSIKLTAMRIGGSKGAVSAQYATKNQQAVAGKDYEAADGTFEWADGEAGPDSGKSIDVIINDDDEFEKDETFTCVLTEPTGGAKFDKTTDGGADSAITTIIILNDDDKAQRLGMAMRLFRMDADSAALANDAWVEQIVAALPWKVPEDGGTKAKFMHVLISPWKLFFAIVPPAGIGKGWPCFVMALVAIGFQVMLISDFATQMGCQLNLPDTITAITFVALGTSLPDTFASMQAAVGDKYADNSIGNVTGSNSVNVLLGLGLPWLIGAAYWAAVGSSDQWLRMYGPGGSKQLPKSIYEDYRDKGGFYVSKSGLGLSVVVFICTAVATISIILLRRFKLNPPAELGGDKKLAKITAGFLVFLWFVYIGMSCLAEPGFTGSPAIADPF
jgi:Ca2+/Na+ antiporter